MKLWQVRGLADELHGIFCPEFFHMKDQVIKMAVPGVLPIQALGPPAALFIIFDQQFPRFFQADSFAGRFGSRPVFDIGDNTHLEHVRHTLEEDVAGQSVIHHIVFANPPGQCAADIGHVGTSVMPHALKQRRGIMNSTNQFDFRYVKALAGIQQHIPADTFVTQTCRNGFGHLLASAVGSPRNGNNRHGLFL